MKSALSDFHKSPLTLYQKFIANTNMVKNAACVIAHALWSSILIHSELVFVQDIGETADSFSFTCRDPVVLVSLMKRLFSVIRHLLLRQTLVDHTDMHFQALYSPLILIYSPVYVVLITVVQH